MILEFIISSKVCMRHLAKTFSLSYKLSAKQCHYFYFYEPLNVGLQLFPGSSTIWWRLAQTWLPSPTRPAPKQYFPSGSPFSRRPLNWTLVPLGGGQIQAFSSLSRALRSVTLKYPSSVKWLCLGTWLWIVHPDFQATYLLFLLDEVKAKQVNLSCHISLLSSRCTFEQDLSKYICWYFG